MSKLAATLISLATTVVVVTSASISVVSAAHAQQAFETPQKAVDALVAATKGGDQKSILAVLGQGGQDIVSSGDPVADEAALAKFNDAYEAKHLIEAEGGGTAVFLVGNDDYPFPIPLLRTKGGKWSFDTEAGRREILYRRIGRNELSTIQTVLAYVDAQEEYDNSDRTGEGAGIYAQRFFSSEGKKDGLYWPTEAGKEPSPLGELFAAASAEGYEVGDGPSPYHGYYFKILTKQGPAAPGGAADYVVNGKMIGGFALIAYPADYRNSGVMTFMVNYSGVPYQKDLGPNTGDIAEATTSFNPDSTWTKVDPADETQ